MLQYLLGQTVQRAKHEQYGIAFPSMGVRAEMLREACLICKSMGTNHRTTFEGKHYRLKDALCEPKPGQSPSIPLWVGGMGERRTLRVVAEVADGWNTFLMPEEEYRRKLDVLAGHCKDFGRDPGGIRKQLGISVILGETEAEAEDRVKERAAAMRTDPGELRERFMGVTPERCAELLRPFRDMGVGDFLMLARPPTDDRTIELFATQVPPPSSLKSTAHETGVSLAL